MTGQRDTRRRTMDKPRATRLRFWLTGPSRTTPNGRYRHRLLKENQANRQAMIGELVNYYKWAHNDVMSWLCDLIGDGLDPLGEIGVDDPLLGYPCNIDSIAMQGCFGEVFAGLIAEHFDLFGEEGWEVPAFLFRFHNTIFEE